MVTTIEIDDKKTKSKSKNQARSEEEEKLEELCDIIASKMNK